MSNKPLLEFLYNPGLDIFIHPEQVVTDYRDGSEDYVLSVLKEAAKTKTLSGGLSGHIRDWPSRYHFSDRRVNLLESIKELPDKDAKVLELGCGTGPITRWLAENFPEVEAIEGDQLRAAAARQRTSDLGNVKVYCGDISKTVFEAGKYGFVTIIGVLEYVPFYNANSSVPAVACMEFLGRVSSALQDNGILALAIENKLGLKYFSGCKEDHTNRLFDGLIDYPDKSAVTFSRNELEEMLVSSGFNNIQFYHAFPDYKLPVTLLREDDEVLSLSTCNWIKTPFEDYSGKRLHIFPELLLLKSLTRARLLSHFSNSFLVLASKSVNVNLKADWLIKKFYTHEGHRPDFSHVITLNKRDGAGYTVKRAPVYLGQPEAIIDDVQYRLQEESEFIHGDSLTTEINKILLSRDYTMKLTAVVMKMHSELMSRYFSGDVDNENYPLVAGEAVDFTFFNIIQAENGDYTLIDKKWRFGERIPADFVLFRNLYYLFLNFQPYIDEKKPAGFVLSYLKTIYINYDNRRLEKAVRLEEIFQSAIHDKKITLDLNVTPVHSLPDLIAGLEAALAEKEQHIREITAAALELKNDYMSGLLEKTEEKTSNALRVEKLSADLNSYAYQAWINWNEPDYTELLALKKMKFKYAPKISIVTPVFNTDEQFLRDMMESVLGQTYSNWELCIAEGGSSDKNIRRILREYSGKYKRIKVVFLEKNKGIAGNSNAALALATGDFITFLDHDDILPLFALHEVANHINEFPDADFLYSDEDKITEDGRIRLNPHFKPDWSPDLLRSYNYITHLSVFRKELIEKTGPFREGFEGSQDYDLILRATEQSRRIIHIPKVLYHWRISAGSAAGDAAAKPYALVSAKEALREHLQRVGLRGRVEDGRFSGSYKITCTVNGRPAVSVLIPNKDNADDLRKCLESITAKTAYKNYEITVIENSSVEERTFRYYEEIKRSGIKVIQWNGPFNYAAINNFAVKTSKGEYLLFLNNDTEVINPDWMERLLEHAQRKEVGAVGAKLYYPDGRIQHAGVILGIGIIAGHAHRYLPGEASGYVYRASVVQDLSAVTGACMMMRRAVFEEAGDFDENYSHDFNDIDLCMKVREKGYLIVFTPFAELYHPEGKTRGHDKPKEMLEIYRKEVLRFNEKWGHILEKGDPYYNPNLSLEKEDFSIDPLAHSRHDAKFHYGKN